MKAIKFFRPYRLRYNARLTAIGTLAVVGLLALSGEPAENDTHYALTALLQLLTLLGSFSAAAWLYFRWGFPELKKRIENINKARHNE